MAGLTGRAVPSTQARAQYAAMVAMRWHMFVNGLHSIHGILDLGATGITWLFYCVIGLGAALGLGAGGYALAQQGAWRQLPTLFWAATILWLLLPVVVASYQEQADLRILLRFPVSLGSYFRLYLISGLMEASTIVGALCCLGIWIGIDLARPRTGGPLALVLVVFAVFNILLVRAVFAWIDRWLAHRRSREILGAVFMVVVLGAQFLNPALYRHQDQGSMSGQQRREQAQDTRARYAPILRTAYEVQQWLPAGAAARAVEQSAQGHSAQAMAWLDLLGMWALVCGGTLNLRLRAEYRGENLGWAPVRTQVAEPERSWRLGGSGARTAVLERGAQPAAHTALVVRGRGSALAGAGDGWIVPGGRVRSFVPVCIAALRGLRVAGVFTAVLQQPGR